MPDRRSTLTHHRLSLKRAARTIQRLEWLVAGPERLLYERGLLDRSRLRFPDFLGIGGIKSATTWLYENLRGHPDVYLPPMKELHYFNLRRHRRLKWYVAHYADAGSRLTGEITPGYSLIGRGQVQRIARLMPEVRLILMIRNPIDRAWSHAVMTLARKQDRPAELVPDAEYKAFLASDRCREAGDYDAIIDRWTTHFPPNRLHVTFFDHVERDPVAVLRAVFAHLGLTTDVDLTASANVVIDRGVAGQVSIIGKDTRTTVPARFRPMLEEMYSEPIGRLSVRLGPQEQWLNLGDP